MPCSCRLSKPMDLEPDQFGSWFSEAIRSVMPFSNAILGPSGHEKVEAAEKASLIAAINDLNTRVTALQAPSTSAGVTSGSFDQFLTQNRQILLFGGLGIAAIVLLKPRKA